MPVSVSPLQGDPDPLQGDLFSIGPVSEKDVQDLISCQSHVNKIWHGPTEKPHLPKKASHLNLADEKIF